LATEFRVEEANKAMAAIADDVTATDRDRRERLGAIWTPVAHALIDNAATAPNERLRKDVSNPNFVGITCDSRRPVYLDRVISDSGMVYRKFAVADRLPPGE
jgi:hypothetical protein